MFGSRKYFDTAKQYQEFALISIFLLLFETFKTSYSQTLAMLYWVIMFVLVVFPFFWLRAVKSYSWEKTINELLPKPKNLKKEIIGSITLCALLLVTFIFLSLTLTLVGLNDLEKVGAAIGAQTQEGVLLLIGTLVIVLFIEELFFRAFLVNRVGLIISTLIFTVAHIGYGSIAELIGVFILGLIIAYWFKKNNSIIQVYLAHLLYDLVAIALYLMI